MPKSKNKRKNSRRKGSDWRKIMQKQRERNPMRHDFTTSEIMSLLSIK